MLRNLLFLVFVVSVAGCANFPSADFDSTSAYPDIDPATQIVITSEAARNPEQIVPDLYPDGAKPTPEPVVRTGRYTLSSTAPTSEQQDLMAQIIEVRIPAKMEPTVKEAIEHALLRTGYSLCPTPGTEVEILFSRPLPAAHYTLGPMTLRNVLQILGGPAFMVEVDEVARSVCFLIRDEYRPAQTIAITVGGGE